MHHHTQQRGSQVEHFPEQNEVRAYRCNDQKVYILYSEGAYRTYSTSLKPRDSFSPVSLTTVYFNHSFSHLQIDAESYILPSSGFRISEVESHPLGPPNQQVRSHAPKHLCVSAKVCGDAPEEGYSCNVKGPGTGGGWVGQP